LLIVSSVFLMDMFDLRGK